MKLQKSPNRWSCLPASFAMACDVYLDRFLEDLGHDGSEIKWPDLGEPRQRRAFHIQECVKVCIEYGFQVVQLELRPKATADGFRSYNLDHTDFVNRQMQLYNGVLTGKGRVNFHAVAWDRYQVFDPAGVVYDLPNQLFTPHTFWAVI